MMTVFMVLGVVLVGASAAVMLRQTQPVVAMLLATTVGVVLLVTVLGELTPLIDRVEHLLDGTVGDGNTTILLKTVGIGLVTQFAADVCRDAGESSLAGKAEMAGRVLLLLCGLPLFEQAASLLESMIRGQAVVG